MSSDLVIPISEGVPSVRTTAFMNRAVDLGLHRLGCVLRFTSETTFGNVPPGHCRPRLAVKACEQSRLGDYSGVIPIAGERIGLAIQRRTRTSSCPLCRHAARSGPFLIGAFFVGQTLQGCRWKPTLVISLTLSAEKRENARSLGWVRMPPFSAPSAEILLSCLPTRQPQ